MLKFDGSHEHAAPVAEQGPTAGVPAPAAKKRLLVANQAAAANVRQRIQASSDHAATANDPQRGELTSPEQAPSGAMTLVELDAYAFLHPEWLEQATSGTAAELKAMLLYARNVPGAIAGLGHFSCRELIAGKLGQDVSYAGYSVAVYTGHIRTVVHTLERARKYGAAIQSLLRVMRQPDLREIIPQSGRYGDCLGLLIDRNLVDSFTDYVLLQQPLLTARNGAEIDGFVQFHQETGGKVTQYRERLKHVRTPHHFEVAALEQLVVNEADTSKSRPLLIVLHTAEDWNGAFMRSPVLSQVILDRRNNVILIEGARSLDSAGQQLAAAAVRYGQRGRVDQVLISGHGEGRLMELAANGAGARKLKSERLQLGGKDKATTTLLDIILRTMDASTPNHRILLDSCLVNSSEIPLGTPIASSPEKGAKDLREAFEKNPSLAEYVRERARALGKNIEVFGANGSLDTAMGTRYIDAKSAALALVVPTDPAVTGSKLEYVEHGKESVGVLRALVQSWAQDANACKAAVLRRLSTKPGNDWSANIIAACFRRTLDCWDDPGHILSLSRSAVPLSALDHGDCSARRLVEEVPVTDRDALFSSLIGTELVRSTPRVALLIDQAWMQTRADRIAPFLSVLGASFTFRTAKPLVDVDLAIAAEGALSAGDGSMVLAMLLMRNVRPAALAHLRKVVVGRRVPRRVVDLLDGELTEGEFIAGVEQLVARDARADPATTRGG